MAARTPIARRSVRAVPIDDHDRLVVVKRTKADRPVYWRPQVAVWSPRMRTGAGHHDPTRGGFETDVIALTAVAEIDLRPPEPRDFLVANAEALLAEADLLGS